MSSSRCFWNRTLSLGLGLLVLGSSLWLASAASANGGGCEPPSSSQTQPSRNR